MKIQNRMPIPADVNHIDPGAVFLVFEQGQTLTGIKIAGHMDHPDFALVLSVHVFGKVNAHHEANPFDLIPMSQLSPRVAVLTGELVADIDDDLRSTMATDGIATGFIVSSAADVCIIAADANGQLKRCSLAGRFVSTAEPALRFGRWRLWLRQMDALGKQELVPLATGPVG